MLELLGLDPTGETVYRHMLATPGAGVNELVRDLDLTEKQVRTALDQLADLDLIRASRDRPGTLLARDPRAALDSAVARHEEDLARRQQQLADHKAAAAKALAHFADLHSRADQHAATRLIGLDAVQSHIEQLAHITRSELLSVTPGAALAPEALDLARPLDAAMLERGVTIRVLYQTAARNNHSSAAYAHWMTEHGAQVRTAPLTPPRLLIYDRAHALIPIDPTDTTAGALHTREPAIIATLTALFDHAWDTAIPFGTLPATHPGTGLTPTERTLQTLLAGGMTDESAAKKLGVSLRTVRRQMATLMERLGATSRFEAGLKAAQRGWL